MDTRTRQHVGLLLDHQTEASTKALQRALEAMIQSHSARGHLQSGGTVKVAVSTIEESASNHVSACVDQVAPISKSTEAYAMLSASLEAYLRLCRRHLEKAVNLAKGPGASSNRSDSVDRAALGLFEATCRTVRRQLQIHAFEFTTPDTEQAPATAPATATGTNRGGRPPAQDWESMWAALGAALYVGDLKPTSQAAIERAMLDWVSAQGGEPNVSTIRPRARKLWRSIEAAQ